MKATTLSPLVLLVACATVGSPGKGDVDLPTTGVGPFRKLDATELLDVAPFVLESKGPRYREPAALALDADPASARVALYVVATKTDAKGSRDVIVRTRADDARSFFGNSADIGTEPVVVLEPSQAWEGDKLAGPSVLADSGQILLFYAAAGGIGLARSTDGFTFTREALPVLAPDPSVAWETNAPHAPSVARYPDGRFRMLYAAGGFIGEAESDDGVAWRRLDADPVTRPIDPVLGPSSAPPPDSLLPGERPPFDTVAVDDPCLLPRVTPGGRLQVRVLYTGYDAAPRTAGHSGAIGFAARYGDQGFLVRQPTPVYSVSKNEAAPALFEWGGGVMLYVHQDFLADTATNTTFPAIAAAFAPPAKSLGAPAGYASGP